MPPKPPGTRWKVSPKPETKAYTSPSVVWGAGRKTLQIEPCLVESSQSPDGLETPRGPILYYNQHKEPVSPIENEGPYTKLLVLY